MPNWERLLMIGVAVSVAISGAAQYRLSARFGSLENELRNMREALASRPPGRPSRPPLSVPTNPVSLSGAPVKGKAGARVAVIEYSDFDCPYCGSFTRDTLPKLEETYVESGKVLFAFRYLPLERLHPDAVLAAEAAECAHLQGRFWQMHDLLFQTGTPVKRDLRALGKDAHLDLRTYDACLKGQATSRVRNDYSDAVALGISSTPTFLIGRIEPNGAVRVSQRLSGAQPLANFSKILDPLIDANEP